MSTKETTIDIWNKHLTMATTDGHSFRRTVIDEIMSTLGCTRAAASTLYNNCKKTSPSVEGLGRTVKTSTMTKTNKDKEQLLDDNECYTVIELLRHKDDMSVGRCRSYLFQGEASEDFDMRVNYRPTKTWVMIKGLGPISGDTYKLQTGEVEIKRYEPINEMIVSKVFEYEEVDT